ncbi:MAG: SURF1 family protein [Candidatus Puniceispirillaceae bacterium]
MKFRPLLWPTLFSVPALLVLIMLGSWQVQRLTWKTELINQFQERSQAQPVYPASDSLKAGEIEFQRIAIDGEFIHDQTVYLTGRTYEGNAGFHVVTVFETNRGDQFFINRGWVSEAYREPESRPFSMIEGATRIEGIIRLPQRQGQFVPDNEPDKGFWFTMKPDEVASFLKLPNVEQAFFIDAVRPLDAKLTLPIAAEVKVDVRNAHLNYAITWFGLALSLIGVYIAYHHSLGRLTFGSAKKEDE